MIEFNQKQVEKLRGQYTAIGNSCGVTDEYVRKILLNQRNQNTQKAKEVAEKAKAILDVLEAVL